MDIHSFVQRHWLDLLLLPGNMLAAEAVIRNAAEAHGYTKTASLCRKMGNFLSFVSDVIGGLLSKKQGGLNAQVPIAGSPTADSVAKPG